MHCFGCKFLPIFSICPFTITWMHRFCAELQKRNEIFTKNLRTIKKMQDTERGTAKYGVTEFADLTGDEFRQRKAMPLGILKADPAMKQAALMDVKDTPDSVDWRKKGMLCVLRLVQLFFVVVGVFYTSTHTDTPPPPPHTHTLASTQPSCTSLISPFMYMHRCCHCREEPGQLWIVLGFLHHWQHWGSMGHQEGQAGLSLRAGACGLRQSWPWLRGWLAVQRLQADHLSRWALLCLFI